MADREGPFLDTFTTKTTPMTRQIFAAQINFEDIPLHVREKFSESEKNIRRLLAAFRPLVAEVYILANKSRFTVYIVHEEMAPLTDFFHGQHNLKGYVQYYYNSGESVTHLMATASGLLSPVKGEGAVLADLIRCYEWAASCSCIGITLDNTLTRAIETGRAVRTQTGIDKFCSSVVETGIELVYNRLENLHSKNFLIIGTGKMARVAMEYLTGEGIRNIALTGHDEAQTIRLAKKFGVKHFQLDSLGHFFLKADVVIGASHQELPKGLIPLDKRNSSGEGDDKNRFILDLGIPPNFDVETVEIFSDEAYNLDDLRRFQPSPLESFGGLEAAWRMVMKASGDFVHLLQLLNQSPVLSAYLTRQFTLKNGQVKSKPKRTLRNILTFKRSDSILGITHAKAVWDVKLHVNNYFPDNGLEIVRNVQPIKKFRFVITDN